MKLIQKLPALLFIAISMSSSVFAQTTARDTNLITIANPVWMPDGKSILVSAILFDRTRKKPPQLAVYELNLNSKKLSLLIANAYDAVASPDQTTIAFARPVGQKPFDNDLFLFDIKSKKETPLVVDTVAQFGPNWSPDGKKLVFNTRDRMDLGPRLAQININVVDIATRQIQQLTQNNHSNYNPVWSPAGDKIVYYHEKGDNRDQIYITDTKGSFHKNLTADTSTHNFYPSWMNDQIIYTTNAGSVRQQLAVIDKDGGNKKILMLQKADRAFYNPKVNQVLYTISSRTDGTTVNIYDLKTKKVEVLLTKEQVERLFDTGS